MSCYFRPRIPGASVYFTVTLAHQGSHLLTDEITRLRAAVRQTMRERPFYIDAMVVLPDHIHAVWTMPDGDSDYSVRWGAIKARFTRSLRNECKVGFNPSLAKELGYAVGWNPTLHRSPSKQIKGDAGIWQRRFWEHHVRNQREMQVLINHCHANPVKHGLVKDEKDWPYSSVHRAALSKQYDHA